MRIEQRSFPVGAGSYHTRWVLFDDNGKVVRVSYEREGLIDRSGLRVPQ
jgi:hypothetical protein